MDTARAVENHDGVVKEYGAGDFFGELALVSKQPRAATVRCTESTVLLSLDSNIVQDVLPGQLNTLINTHRRGPPAVLPAARPPHCV